MSYRKIPRQTAEDQDGDGNMDIAPDVTVTQDPSRRRSSLLRFVTHRCRLRDLNVARKGFPERLQSLESEKTIAAWNQAHTPSNFAAQAKLNARGVIMTN